jgi:hypothetical protein
MYTDAAGAKNGIKALVEWAKGKDPAKVKPAKEAGKFHFTVEAKNGAARRRRYTVCCASA